MQSPTAASSQRPAAAQAYLLLTIASLAWGGNVVASRLAIGEVSPMALTCLRWFVVVAIFMMVGRRQLIADWPLLRPHWRFGLIMGASGYTVFSAALFIAAYYTSAVNLAILQGALPVMVLIGALLADGTRIGAMQMFGVMLTLVGVFVVASAGNVETVASLGFNFGDVLMLLACASYAAYTVALRRKPDVPGLSFFFLMAAGGCLASVPLALIEAAVGKAQWPSLQGWAVVVFVGLFPSLIAQRAFMRGVELIGPGRAGLFVNLVPVFGAFLSVALLGEKFANYHAVALVLVLGGILLAEQAVRR
jgi:drug/metabolite transporter (DMT)-like permease